MMWKYGGIYDSFYNVHWHVMDMFEFVYVHWHASQEQLCALARKSDPPQYRFKGGRMLCYVNYTYAKVTWLWKFPEINSCRIVIAILLAMKSHGRKSEINWLLISDLRPLKGILSLINELFAGVFPSHKIFYSDSFCTIMICIHKIGHSCFCIFISCIFDKPILGTFLITYSARVNIWSFSITKCF